MTRLTRQEEWYCSETWETIIQAINDVTARLADDPGETWDDLDDEFTGGFSAIGLDWTWWVCDSEVRDGNYEGWNFLLSATARNTGRVVYSGSVANYTPRVWTDELEELMARIRQVFANAEEYITAHRIRAEAFDIFDSIELDRDPDDGHRRTLGDYFTNRREIIEPHRVANLVIPGRCSKCGERFDTFRLVSAIKADPYSYEPGVCPDCWERNDEGPGTRWARAARRNWERASWTIEQARRNAERQEVDNA